MAKKPFNEKSVNTEELFETFANGRIGELITAVIGNDELQRRFESHPEFQEEEFEGKPSGIIALDLGIVTEDAKNALLVAQAAARTIKLADTALNFAEKRKDMIDSSNEIDTDEYVVSTNDEIFKFVGSERDPKALQQAQATWQIAQISLNTEIGYINESIRNPDGLYYAYPQGADAAQGLKNAAKSHLETASHMLSQEDFVKESQQIQALAASIAVENYKAPKPSNIASNLLFAEERAYQNANIVLCGDYWSVLESEKKTMLRLSDLTKTNSSTENKPELKK